MSQTTPEDEVFETGALQDEAATERDILIDPSEDEDEPEPGCS